MPDIFLSKINESFIKIHCQDDGIYYELDDAFTFYADGYKFMPKYKNGIWDGKIHLVDIRKRRTMTGLYHEIIKFAKRNKYSIKLSKDIELPPKKEFDCDWLNLPFKPYDYQHSAINAILNDKKRLVESPTGSGKSLIIYGSIRNLRNQNKKVLLVVPTVSLVEQMYKDFEDYGWRAIDSFVHKIYSGRDKSNTDDVVITTWQSIFKLDQSWFEDFDAVFIDEAHLASATSLKGIMEKCVNAEYRIGLTGTIQDAKANKLTLIGLFGPIFNTIKSVELMKQGVLSDLKIEAISLVHSDIDRKVVSKFKYKDELDTIVADERRNKFICNLALDQEHNCLILFNYIDKHGDRLYDILEKRNKNKKIFYIHGSTDVEARELAREYTEKHDNVIILASYGTFSTGINIKNLNSVIFAHPYKSKVKNLQSIGRVLRKAPNGKPAILFDISDDYTWKKERNTTYRHFLERLELYESEGFNYKVRRLDI